MNTLHSLSPGSRAESHLHKHAGMFVFLLGFVSLISISNPLHSQTRLSNAASAPIINDGHVTGLNWFEDYYPHNDALPITISSIFSSEHQEVQADLVAPLAAGDRGMLMTLLSYNYADKNDGTGSLGLGFGYAFTDDLSGRFRVHGDFSDGVNDQSVEQISIGFDLYTSLGINFYGNYYLPGDEEFVTREFTNTVGGDSTLRFEDPFAQGHQILQQEFRDTTTRTETDFELRQQALEGLDLGVDFGIPFLCKLGIPARANAGYYHYNGAFGRDDISGFKGGVDIYPLRGVVIGAEYFEDEIFYGDNWVFQGGVTLAIDNIFSPRAWGRSFGKAFSRRPSCEQHYTPMGQMLQRANRKVTPTFDFSDPIQVAQRITPANTTLEQEKVLLDDVIFVNNGGAVGNGITGGSLGGNGTAENPTSSIQQGANLVQTRLGGSGTVYVQATGTAYQEDVIVDSTQVQTAGNQIVAPVQASAGSAIDFVTSLKAVAACGGFSFGGTDAGNGDLVDGSGLRAQTILDGGILINEIARTSVQGFVIENGLGANFNAGGALTNAVPGGTGDPSTLGAGIVLNNVINSEIFCNTISNTARNAIEVFATEGTAVGSTVIRDNTIQDVTGAGNNESNGIFVRTTSGVGFASSIANLEIFDNLIQNVSQNGIRIPVNGPNNVGPSGILGGRIDSNTITGFDADGISANTNGNETQLIFSSISNNIISSPTIGNDGIDISNNTANNPFIDIAAINNNTIEVNSVGIRLAVNNTADPARMTNFGTVNGNTITGGSNSIQVTNSNANGGVLSIASIDGNSLLSPRVAGVRIDDNGPIQVGSISTNIIRDAGTHGIDIQIDNNNTHSFGAINGNDILGVARSGIRIANTAGASNLPIASITGNIIDDFGVGNAAGANNGNQDNNGIIIVANTGSFTIGDMSGNLIGTRMALLRDTAGGGVAASNGIFLRDNNGAAETIAVNGAGNVVVFDSAGPGTANTLDSGDSLRVNNNGNSITFPGSSLEVNGIIQTFGGALPISLE